MMKHILDYQPIDELETVQKNAFLYFIKKFGDAAYDRENLTGHLTVSCWIVNHERSKVLMIHHNLYQMWSWIGGHADNDQNLLNVAHKETLEETGLSEMKLLSPAPIDLNVLSVDDHIKNGKFVPCHLHYNVVFAFEADENLPVRIKPDENSGVRWIDISKIAQLCNQDKALPYYQRIMQKIKKIS